jgi:hypothetical protein
MPGLRVVSEQHQGHAGHVPNVVEQRIVRQRLLLGGRRHYVNARCHRWFQKSYINSIKENLEKWEPARGPGQSHLERDGRVGKSANDGVVTFFRRSSDERNRRGRDDKGMEPRRAAPSQHLGFPQIVQMQHAD